MEIKGENPIKIYEYILWKGWKTGQGTQWVKNICRGKKKCFLCYTEWVGGWESLKKQETKGL